MPVNPDGLVAYDARCVCCENLPDQDAGEGVHIIWVQDDHETGDSVGYAHIDKPGACGEYAEHVLEARLTAITHPAARV